MADSQFTSRRCPECHAVAAAGAQTCEQCGASLRRPEISAEPSAEARAQSSTASTILESLLIALILGSLIGALWMMRPDGRSSAMQGPRLTPTPLPTSTPTFTRTPTATPSFTPTAPPTPTPSFYVHKVEAGETLIYIALEYGTTVTAILKANDMDEDDFLHINQELIIPLDAGFELPTPTATPLPRSGFNVVTHTIRAGDTLLAIAAEYETAVEDIVEANGLAHEEVLLHPGEVLTIPSGATPTPVVPTSTPTATPSRTPQPSPTPAEPTATPRFRKPAPVLLGPPDGALLEGGEALVNWASVGVLSDETWYVVRLRTARPGEPEVTREAWVKPNAWRLRDDLAPATGTTQRYRWDVTVVRRTGEDEIKALSPRSEIRTFQWGQ
ncbi:MAG: N-acetylmuramoyl-L-alanine amidase sle1 [Anaerolineales bacterium]|nr:N-acetylmuramoyl-L-alanine amidase sle1 [Anaerolineales bacterium]